MTEQYPVPLVGEQHYQAAVRALSEGDEVSIVREMGNPYDRQALAVRDDQDRNIGYIPRDSFLREAINTEGKGCRAWIEELEPDRRGHGFTHVLLTVELCDEDVPERAYVPA